MSNDKERLEVVVSRSYHICVPIHKQEYFQRIKTKRFSNN